MKNFYNVLVNTLIANVTTSYLWFGLTFWIYLETKSVLATAIVGGSYMLLITLFSLIFGVIVDHNKKKFVMVLSSLFTLICYVGSGLIFISLPEATRSDIGSLAFWIFSSIILLGSVVENMRNIALSTTVTLLVPKANRDKANGMVGTVHGIAFMVTSVFSGLSIGLLGMGWTLTIAIALTALALVHLLFISIPEKSLKKSKPVSLSEKVDIKGSVAAIKSVPGLIGLIIFTTFNNLVGGVFMALMDPYGLTLFSVEWWGVVLGITSFGFVIGGLVVSKFGLGKNPLRTLLLVNLGVALLSICFTLREFWLLYAAGIFIFMCLMPAAEAAEQTIIQRVVPYKRQGRVFGFAQSIESAATPISAFLIGPIAEFGLIPFINSAEGRSMFGWLLGDGDARGIALIFVFAGLIILAATLLAFKTKSYRLLSSYYAKS